MTIALDLHDLKPPTHDVRQIDGQSPARGELGLFWLTNPCFLNLRKKEPGSFKRVMSAPVESQSCGETKLLYSVEGTKRMITQLKYSHDFTERPPACVS